MFYNYTAVLGEPDS